MTKLFTVFVFSMILIQSLLLPSVVKSNECPTVTVTALPATDIAATSATLNATVCVTYHGLQSQLQNAGQGEELGPLVVEYGTNSGAYTERHSTTLGSNSNNATVIGKSSQLQEDSFCETYSVHVENLQPCTTYYFGFRYRLLFAFRNENLSGARGAGIGLDSVQLTQVLLAQSNGCPLYYNSNEMSFTTTGCPTLIGVGPTSHGTGSFSGTTTTPTTNLSNIIVQSATITSTKVSPGEKVDVTANVINRGGSNGAFKVTLYINNQEAESKGITLTSGESTQVHFSVSQNDPGTYSVYVNGVPAGNLTVDLFTNNDVLIYGIIALFAIGIIGVLYLVVRRRTV